MLLNASKNMGSSKERGSLSKGLLNATLFIQAALILRLKRLSLKYFYIAKFHQFWNNGRKSSKTHEKFYPSTFDTPPLKVFFSSVPEEQENQLGLRTTILKLFESTFCFQKKKEDISPLLSV
jgi:hypothetical protein